MDTPGAQINYVLRAAESQDEQISVQSVYSVVLMSPFQMSQKKYMG